MVQSLVMQMTCDVPQGSILGPLLCINFINNLVVNSSDLAYADDTIIRHTVGKYRNN